MSPVETAASDVGPAAAENPARGVSGGVGGNARIKGLAIQQGPTKLRRSLVETAAPVYVAGPGAALRDVVGESGPLGEPVKT